ncbi:MAG: hypothetical protein QOE36_2116, partial [Gaiellaceae bacterium]|nr:hypothetical protein [Gaiellaceae bacterium]
MRSSARTSAPPAREVETRIASDALGAPRAEIVEFLR